LRSLKPYLSKPKKQNKSMEIDKHLKRYVGIKTVSEYTSLPVQTLYEWAGTGRIPSIKIGRRLLFDLRDIDLVMNSFKRSSNQCEKTSNKIISGINENII
jgi:excisionase family DNA binding protein